MSVVYRATDRLTGQEVALKRMALPEDRFRVPSHAEDPGLPVELAKEFKTLASVRHPNIISVLDYGFDEQRQPFYTMDLLKDARTILEAAQGRPLTMQVNLLVQTLQALAYLHRRGILHRDLKPENVMVMNGHVKVLDFGLAVIKSLTTDQITETVGGTIAYMAPELLQGKPGGRATDLYAIGIIAYELFAGRYPFDDSNVGILLSEILTRPADVSSIGLGDDLAEVLRRLLAKNREERYGAAGEVILDLCEAVDQPLPPETSEIRESFLQAAKFVGRDDELAKLSEALNAALASQGSAWLVGGESGVGKSRLVDELRTLALVEGALVLQGQAVGEGGGPYQLWRDVLRGLVLTTDLEEEEASVLKALVPDIGVLLGREVPDAPLLEPQATQSRLLQLAADMFSRQSQPAVVILEDMQWAGSESLAMLSRISQIVSELRLLLVGSYRDDDRPDLPAELPGMKLLKLERLSKRGIADLSASMLGETGRQPQVVKLLERETEGNPFFVVEVVRTLAEEVGQLDKISAMTLPARVFAGGMQEIIQYRLSRVPSQALPLLHCAAALGRMLDFGALDLLYSREVRDRWLTACANVAVLEFHEGRWRFAHDKLRDGLLDSLSAEESRSLHQRVATVIEPVFANSPERAATLAHLWGMAGDETKEGHYSALAGEQALLSGAYEAAVTFLQRALTLQENIEPGPLRLAILERQLGEASYSLGSLGEGQEHIRHAVALLGKPMPHSGSRLFASLGGQILRQALHRLWPDAFVGRATAARQALREAAYAYKLLAEIYLFTSDNIATLYSALRTLNLAERIGPCPELARAYADMAPIALLLRLQPLAETYCRMAREIAGQINEPQITAYVLLATTVYTIPAGNWADSRDSLKQANLIHLRLGDWNRLGIGWSLQAHTHYFLGEFERSNSLYAQLLQLAQRSGSVQHQAWGLDGQAESLLRLGGPNHEAEVIALLEKSLALMVGNPDRSEQLFANGLLAVAYLRQGQLQSASQAAENAAHLIAQSPPIIYSLLEGYSGVAQTCLALWETSASAPLAERKLLARLAQRACRDFQGYARVFPIGRPRAALWQGLYDWLEGRPARARSSWQNSLVAARKLGMPLESGLAHYEIGRHLAASDSARLEHLRRACDIFGQLGASYHLAQAQAALESQ